jgi:hypothetical protein
LEVPGRCTPSTLAAARGHAGGGPASFKLAALLDAALQLQPAGAGPGPGPQRQCSGEGARAAPPLKVKFAATGFKPKIRKLTQQFD